MTWNLEWDRLRYCVVCHRTIPDGLHIDPKSGIHILAEVCPPCAFICRERQRAVREKTLILKHIEYNIH